MELKKYIIAVGSREISRQVQEALFLAGFRWQNGQDTVGFTYRPIICVNSDIEGCMSHIGDSSYATEKIRSGRVLITAQEVIENPFQLDGAKQPVKEMTVEQISDALGYEVKVVKS